MGSDGLLDWALVQKKWAQIIFASEMVNVFGGQYITSESGKPFLEGARLGDHPNEGACE